MNPLVSILIPAYNAGRWLRSTIESALAQTWPRVEIIVVDDGSSDGTFDVARQFESAKVLAITRENQGASSCRNEALRRAQGQYIQWLDADDLLLPDKITRQMQVAENHSPRTVFSSAWGGFYYRTSKARFRPNSLWSDRTPADWLMRKFENNDWMANNAWLVSRSLSEAAGPWDDKLTLDDDGEYFARLVRHCEEIRFVPEARSLVRRASFNTLSTSSSLAKSKLESQFRSMTLQIKYLRELENSLRARQACCTYLQNWLVYFYPECGEIVKESFALAEGLGCSLAEPKLAGKYELVRRAFGWTAAKKARFALPALKARWRLEVDRSLACVESIKR